MNNMGLASSLKPLHAAIIGKQDAAVKILLDNHADVSIFVLRLVGVI